MARYDPDLEQPGPEFAGNVEAIMHRVPGDAVEHGLGIGDRSDAQQAGESTQPRTLPLEGDARDPVRSARRWRRFRRAPTRARRAGQPGGPLSRTVMCAAPAGCRIKEMEIGGAVREDEGLAVLGQPPAFPGVIRGCAGGGS